MSSKTIINAENKPEATEIFAFVQSLDDEKRKAFDVFVDGARFMQSLMANAQPPAAQDSTDQPTLCGAGREVRMVELSKVAIRTDGTIP